MGLSLVGTELGISLEPGDLDADLLVIDPDTFPAVAHWDDALSGRPLDELIGAITEYDRDRLPVVVSDRCPKTSPPSDASSRSASAATTRWWSRSSAGPMPFPASSRNSR